MAANKSIENDLSLIDPVVREFSFSPWIIGTSKDRLCRMLGPANKKSLKITIRQETPNHIIANQRPEVQMGVIASFDKKMYNQNECFTSTSKRIQFRGRTWPNEANWNELIPQQKLVSMSTNARTVNWVQYVGPEPEVLHVIVKRKKGKEEKEGEGERCKGDESIIGNLNVFKFPVIESQCFAKQCFGDWSTLNIHWTSDELCTKESFWM